MRVAICLSGLVRTYRDTYNNLLANLIQPNNHHQLDIFISTWPIEHSNNSMERTRRLAWTGPDTPPFPENGIDYNDLQTKYKPMMLTIERPREFVVPWLRETPGLNIQSVMSMIYKIHAADLLRRHHESMSDFTYDLVVRHRFDTLIPMVVSLDDLPKDKLTVPSMMQPRWHPDYDWTNDKFAVGSSQMMSIYADWLLHLERIVVERSVPIQPEIMLFNHLSHNKIELNEMGAEFEMVRIPGY